MGKLTKEQINYIKTYGDKITTIDDFITGVRKLPGMYIGAKNNTGWIACIREIFQNAIDESLRKNSPCHYIRLIFDERNQSAFIEDTGSGIPHGMIINIFTTERSSSNYEKKAGEYTSGAHGVGSGVAVALSDHFEVSSYVLGKAVHVEFEKGVPWKYGEKEIKCPNNKQGTTIYMTPDLSILDSVNVSYKEIQSLAIKILPIINIGDIIDFTGIDKDGKEYHTTMKNTDGIITGLNMISSNPIMKPIYFSKDNGTIKADIFFTYDADLEENIVSYANFTPTINGTHVDGFNKALCNYMTHYMNKFYMSENSKFNIISNDVKTGLKAVVSVAHLHPVFAGQFKGILSNEDVKKFVYELVTSGMDEWTKTHSNEFKKICKHIKDVAEIRARSDEGKIKLSKQYKKNVITGDPNKFIKPSEKKGSATNDLELFIVEGNSAMAPARSGRDPRYQGIFPIQGKLPNAFNIPKEKFLKNSEVAAIITLVTGGKYKWDKIIFMTDADPDGSHIKVLLLRLFLLYMPEYIESGKVYAAVPPLFGIEQRGKIVKYFTTTNDLAKYGQSLFIKKHSIKDINNCNIHNKDMINIFTKFIDYSTELNILSNTLAVNPYLLEDILFYLSDKIQIKQKLVEDENDEQDIYINTSKLSKDELNNILRRKYKFINVDVVNNFINITGLVDDRYQNIVLNNHTISICLDMIKTINKMGIKYFIMDNIPCTMYTIINTLNSILPNNINRFKGLGEQNPEELKESTMGIEKRTLIRYNLEDVKKTIEDIRVIDSDKSVLLKGIEGITRRDIE